MKDDEKIKELAKEKERLENFVFTASHDLKSPLQSIKRHVEIIGYKLKLKEDIQEDLMSIDTICDNSINLIKDLLYMSRIDHDQKKYKDNDLKDLIDGALLNLVKMIEDTDTLILIDPSCLGKIVYCDAVLIINVLQNLIQNGIKFNKSEPPIITIGVLPAYFQDSKRTIFVKDNGIGIAPHRQLEIFNMFERGDKAYSGTGLGLSTAKKIIEAHDENIWVESTIGVGSTFYFNLRKGRLDDEEGIRQRQEGFREVQSSE